MQPSAHLSAARRWWLWLLVAATLLFLVLPSVIVVPMSFTNSTFLEFPPRELSLRWYRTYVETSAWRDATLVSLEVAVIAVAVATPLGTAAAYMLHVTQPRFRRAMASLLIAPMLVPHILIAVGLFFA